MMSAGGFSCCIFDLMAVLSGSGSSGFKVINGKITNHRSAMCGCGMVNPFWHMVCWPYKRISMSINLWCQRLLACLPILWYSMSLATSSSSVAVSCVVMDKALLMKSGCSVTPQAGVWYKGACLRMVIAGWLLRCWQAISI